MKVYCEVSREDYMFCFWMKAKSLDVATNKAYNYISKALGVVNLEVSAFIDTKHSFGKELEPIVFGKEVRGYGIYMFDNVQSTINIKNLKNAKELLSGAYKH